MTNTSADAITTGSLVFIGPSQVPALTEFYYARVTAVGETTASLSLVDPDGADEEFAEEVGLEVLRRRMVPQEESELWSGSYVGHPIAFVQPDGPAMGQWAFGLVTGYHMADTVPWLLIRHENDACKLALQQPFNVIRVDWINYALQTAGGMNTASLYAEELLNKMNEVLGLFNKTRSGADLPAKIINLLSVPYIPSSTVSVIRPDTLGIVSVPRHHVVDCALKKKAKKGVSMFVPPPIVLVEEEGAPAPTTRKRKAAAPPARRASTRRKTPDTQAHDESEDESPPTIMADEPDVRAVLHQNRPLTRGSSTEDQDDLPDAVFDAVEDARRRSASTFRPTALEQRVNDEITHPDNKGKDAQCVLEFAQQAREIPFSRSPPVLRGAFNFGFHIRGLSVMHFARITRPMLLEANPTANMADFSRKNALPPAPTSPSYSELMDAVHNLRRLGRTFYNADTVDVLDAAVLFLEGFGDGGEPDQSTTRRLVLWIDMKLCKFRGLVLSEGLGAAVRVKTEFHLHDPQLSGLLYDQQQSKIATLEAKLANRPISTATGQQGSRDRSGKSRGIPQSVLRLLPKQGSAPLCMKHLSKAGCTGNGEPGKCFSSQRVHFRPATLPAEVKDFITKKFGGLAPEYGNL